MTTAKLGRPEPGTHRAITSSEARLLRAPGSWRVGVDATNRVWLLRSVAMRDGGTWTREWRRCDETGDVTTEILDRCRAALEEFWARDQYDRGVYVGDPDVAAEIRRLREALRAIALVPGVPSAVRELAMRALD